MVGHRGIDLQFLNCQSWPYAEEHCRMHASSSRLIGLLRAIIAVVFWMLELEGLGRTVGAALPDDG